MTLKRSLNLKFLLRPMHVDRRRRPSHPTYVAPTMSPTSFKLVSISARQRPHHSETDTILGVWSILRTILVSEEPIFNYLLCISVVLLTHALYYLRQIKDNHTLVCLTHLPASQPFILPALSNVSMPNPPVLCAQCIPSISPTSISFAPRGLFQPKIWSDTYSKGLKGL